MPKHLKFVFGILLFGMVARFSYLAPRLLTGQMNFQVMQDVCLFILTLGVVKGFADRNALAWKTARVMMLLMLIFTMVTTIWVVVMAAHIDGLYPVVALFALAVVLNGYVIWVLHSSDVKEYFTALPREGQ